ncbi:glutamate-5-semialdehyde dehydrogenase [Malassezia nana]|uniref:glutamate-5-semialdehyde dehydrogenase n=1 Tax=Malassezia nana TaxID=180528 RepID=A0AAF0ELN8_9BASI|nr:glutamate-5-semialdehyde dehydrogenase [Malassezia nana]
MSATDVARQAREAFDATQKHLSMQGSAHADAVRVKALECIRTALEQSRDEIYAANQQDVAEANELVAAGKLSKQLVSRLDLFSKPGKWSSMLQGVSDVAHLPSPLDVCTRATRLAEGAPAAGSRAATGALDLYRVTCPIGVLLCIFEARPEVIVNIACLAIKSGNAAILKGGKESKHSAIVLARCIATALEQSELPRHLIQNVQTRDEIQALLHEERYIDLVIPRGSNALVKAIRREARMPVLGHADGLCAAYIHEDAPERLVIETVLDAKLDYPSACNAIETLLVHRHHCTSGLWRSLAHALLAAGVRLHCDDDARACLADDLSEAERPLVLAATPDDFDTEFLDLDLAVRIVDTMDEAIHHIQQHGSGHTDIILCKPLPEGNAPSGSSAAEIFTRSLSSSSVFVNASSRFADGFRFGFGTEVGISTGRTHARGPVGLEGLVIYKYVLRSSGDGAQTAGAFAPGEHQRAWSHRALDAVYPTL